MAAKKTKDDEISKSKGGIGKIILPILLLVFVMLITFILLVKLDVFGFGTNVMGPKLQNIPIINLILPEMPEEIVVDAGEGDYTFLSMDQAIEKLKATDILLKEKEKEAEKVNEDIARLNTEIERLKVFEANQVQFEKDKTEFDQLVADQVGSEEFIKYVESVFPEQALAIYGELVQEKVITDEIKSLAKMYQEMEPESAASILEKTAGTNMIMVEEILLQLDALQAGSILAAMDPVVADKISRYIYPE